ncbi:major facilitator superfamily domain-containing protein [Plectosphaerella plurivora]|uniref:Major facilitator superfamily domain-containing protein n=1 Tax=Plectosphaerella plurivora TaxID=936078 RepID=A0A9P8VHP1_9PEZI|nr:major facilitator superfamily domain-containing protein [Plectosphaerella plurivora]
MSQTATITRPEAALTPLSDKPTGPEAIELQRIGSKSSRRTARRNSSEEEGDLAADQPPPGHVAQSELQRWNHPKGNVTRLGFAFLTFAIAGMNDAAIGALLPYLEQYYNLTYTTVSLIFLTPFAGYSVAAFTNARIHMKWGQRGIALMAPACHMIAFAAAAAHPPFPVLVVIFAISGFGNGLTDACYCAWVGAMDKSNTIQGFMHSTYSLGALLAPLIATAMVARAGLPWYTYYYIMLGIAALEWVGLSIAFWQQTGAVYRAEHPREEGAKGAGTKEALKSKVTWLCSSFFFIYMGVEVGLGGWVITFMLRVRKASEFAAGASGSGFWAGMVAGRALLGFVTERYGERLCISIYLGIAIGLQLLFWLVPQFIVSAIAVSLLGFFLGPMFPGAITVVAKLLPKHIHVSAMGFAMALGGAGGTIFPFAIGAIANTRGVAVLQPIILALLVVIGGVWLLFPRIKKKE